MNTLAPELIELADSLAIALRQRGWKMATAESCTGGLIAATCTGLSGSSDWLDRGFVTYSNAAKCAQLGVPESLIAAHGAVSEPVAQAMAVGALQQSLAQVSVAVTGVAGPAGGSAEKPVGTVWFGWATPARVFTHKVVFPGDRDAVRYAAVRHALRVLLDRIELTAP